MMTRLLEAQTANTASDAEGVRVQSGIYVAFVFGAFDTASVQLQARDVDSDDEWLNIGDAFTEAGSRVVELPECELRASVTSVGGSTSVTAKIGPRYSR